MLDVFLGGGVSCEKMGTDTDIAKQKSFVITLILIMVFLWVRELPSVGQ